MLDLKDRVRCRGCGVQSTLTKSPGPRSSILAAYSGTNMAKLLASEAIWHAAEATFATFGGFAFAKEYDIERKWREARLYQTAPISTNLILAYIRQHVLGMPRSY